MTLKIQSNTEYMSFSEITYFYNKKLFKDSLLMYKIKTVYRGFYNDWNPYEPKHFFSHPEHQL